MKILLITNTLKKIDGWAQVGASLYMQWKRAGHSVDVISEIGLPHDGISMHTSFSRKPNGNIFLEWKEAVRLRHKLRGRTYDIIICNIEPLVCLAWRIAKLVECQRTILVGHGTYAYYPFLAHKKLRKAAETFEIVCPSEFTQNRIFEWSKRRAKVIPWGVDHQTHRPLALKRKPFFLSVGEQKPRKGTKLALTAFRDFLKTHPHFKYVFAGKVTSYLLDIVDELKLRNNVSILGVVNEERLVKLYNIATAHILPSHNTPSSFEGFGLVHLEANACGCPTVGSRNTANEEVINNSESGYLVDPLTTDELLTAMRELARSNQISKELSHYAIKHASKYKWETAAQRILQ